MGGCWSSIPDQVVNEFSQMLFVSWTYVYNLSKNLEDLNQAMRVLIAKKEDVKRRVEGEERPGRRQRCVEIQLWLVDVLAFEDTTDHLVSTSEVELGRLFPGGIYSKNMRISYLYGKEVVETLREVEKLITRGGEFKVVTEEAPIPKVEELPIQLPIVGQETMLDLVWKRLMDDRVGIVGLYGMGGVGKTTLLTQINNKFSEIGCGFDVVIWVVVSKDATVDKIQGLIEGKLGLNGNDRNVTQRGIDIHKVLKSKKFVLLLDDIWEKVKLNEIGIPNPSGENGCRIAFTTRSQDLCARMGVTDPIEVRCLDFDIAWDLFKQKLGEDTLESHPYIPDLAKKVARKCKGLPLALNIIGETMACKKTVQQWQRAIDILTSSATKFSGMVDEILPILKYSYDSLNGETMKTCFRYCSLFPEDYDIEKERLIEYWICEGLMDENQSRERAFNQGYEILDTLVRASLLLEGVSKSTVKMHDVVREMALWISSDFGKCEERCIVQAGVELRELPDVKNWKNVKWLSLMKNKIKKISQSIELPQLITLLLQENNLTTISGEFFRSMSRLLILDLSKNIYLCELPEQISKLVSLRYLNLSETRIERLNNGLQSLKMLIHLNLEFTSKLESLNGISNFSSLKTLKLWGSKVRLDMSLMKELQLLQQLEFISISICSSLVGKLLLDDSRVRRCIQELYISDYWKEPEEVLVLPAMDNQHKVFLDGCGMREIEIKKIPLNKPYSVCRGFTNISSVKIIGCRGLKDVTWLLFAPNLIHLELLALKELEDVISREKALNHSEMETDISLLFQKLEHLELGDLPKLKNIYWNALPFQHLIFLFVWMCPELRKLPLDSKSVTKVEKLVINYHEEEWIEEIEWEDEATRLRFLPSYRRGSLERIARCILNTECQRMKSARSQYIALISQYRL